MELDVLNELGFIDYILLNWDILNFCHENDIPTGPGRGSAAGSLVLYLINVTKVDPVKYELFFERFVNAKGCGQGSSLLTGCSAPGLVILQGEHR